MQYTPFEFYTVGGDLPGAVPICIPGRHPLNACAGRVGHDDRRKHRRSPSGRLGKRLLEESYNSFMAAVSYLDRLLEPLTEAFTPKMASVLLELRADAEIEAHIGELRQKANAGVLTPTEGSEYKDFVEAVDLISIMQAKARRFLAKRSA